MFRPKVSIFVNVLVVSGMVSPTPHPLHPSPGIAGVVQHNGIDKGNKTLIQPVRKFIVSSSYASSLMGKSNTRVELQHKMATRKITHTTNT